MYKIFRFAFSMALLFMTSHLFASKVKDDSQKFLELSHPEAMELIMKDWEEIQEDIGFQLDEQNNLSVGKCNDEELYIILQGYHDARMEFQERWGIIYSDYKQITENEILEISNSEKIISYTLDKTQKEPQFFSKTFQELDGTEEKKVILNYLSEKTAFYLNFCERIDKSHCTHFISDAIQTPCVIKDRHFLIKNVIRFHSILGSFMKTFPENQSKIGVVLEEFSETIWSFMRKNIQYLKTEIYGNQKVARCVLSTRHSKHKCDKECALLAFTDVKLEQLQKYYALLSARFKLLETLQKDQIHDLSEKYDQNLKQTAQQIVRAEAAIAPTQSIDELVKEIEQETKTTKSKVASQKPATKTQKKAKKKRNDPQNAPKKPEEKPLNEKADLPSNSREMTPDEIRDFELLQEENKEKSRQKKEQKSKKTEGEQEASSSHQPQSKKKKKGLLNKVKTYADAAKKVAENIINPNDVARDLHFRDLHLRLAALMSRETQLRHLTTEMEGQLQRERKNACVKRKKIKNFGRKKKR
jgi:hypothetical protein